MEAGKIHVAAGAVIEDEQDRVLLVKHKPEREGFWKGKWICPGGRLKPGESIREAIAREVNEETHLEIELVKPLIPFERIVWEDGYLKLHVIYLDYLAKIKGGNLKPDDDIGEAIWVRKEDLRKIEEELHEDTRILLRIAGLL